MADSGAIRAGQAYVELGMDDAKLRKGMDEAEGQLDQFAEALKAAAAAVGFGAIANTVKGWVKDFAETGAELYDKWQKAGLSVEEVSKKAAKFGFGDFQGIALAKDLADAFDRLKKATEATFNTIGRVLAPAFIPFLEILIDAEKAFAKFIEENQAVVQAIGAVVGIGATLAAVLAGVAAVVSGVSAVLGPLAAGFSALAGIVTGAFGLIAAAVTFVLSPIGLVIAAIAALMYVALELGTVFRNLGQLISQAWGGIMDAFRAGDLALAWDIALAGLKIAWLEFKNWFMGVWDDIPGFFARVWDRILQAFNSAVGWLRAKWQEFMNWLSGSAGPAAGPRPIPTTPADRSAERANEIARARQEFQELIARAGRQRATVEADRRRRYEEGLGQGGDGARGTFSAFAVGGLVGSLGNPVVRALENLTSLQREELARLQRIAETLQEIASGQAIFR